MSFEKLESELRASGWIDAIRTLDTREGLLRLEAGLVEAIKLLPPRQPLQRHESLTRALVLLRSILNGR